MAADFLTGIIGNFGISLSNPVSLVTNIALSTVIGGLVLLVLAEIIGKKFSENISALNAFVIVLLINIINLFGLLSLAGSFISFVPFLLPLLPIVVWIVMVKFFFKGLSITHSALVGVIGYFLSMYLVPLLVTMALGVIHF